MSRIQKGKAGSASAKGINNKDFAASLRLGFLIHDVSRLRRVVVDRALKPIGLTRSQWWLLSFLGRRDGMTQSALASDVDITKVAIGGLIGRMESAGFVERRPDERDGRLKRVYLTPAGIRMLSSIREQIEQIEIEILRGIPVASLDITTATLSLVKDQLRDMIGTETDDEIE